MKRTLALMGLLIAVPASAAEFPLRGQWEVRAPANPSYQGIVLIDAEGRSTWDSPHDGGRRAIMLGYVKPIDTSRMMIVLTDKELVTRTHCTIRSNELMDCYVARESGNTSPPFSLVKVGPGPARLIRPSQ